MISFAQALRDFTAPARRNLGDFRKTLQAGDIVKVDGQPYIVAAVANCGPSIGYWVALKQEGQPLKWVSLIEVFNA